MAYALRYQAQIFWVGPGGGPMEGLVGLPLPGAGGGTGQIAEFSAGGNVASPNIPIVAGAGAGGALTSADITTLTNGMATDIAAQMNIAATLAKLQAWPSGGV